MRKKVLFVGIALIANIQLNLFNKYIFCLLPGKRYSEQSCYTYFSQKVSSQKEIMKSGFRKHSRLLPDRKFIVEYYHEKA